MSLRLTSFATTSFWLIEIVKVRILTYPTYNKSELNLAECGYHCGIVDRTYLQQKEKVFRSMLRHIR